MKLSYLGPRSLSVRVWLGLCCLTMVRGASGAEALQAKEGELETPPAGARGPEGRGFETALLSGFIGLDFGGRQMHYRERVSNGTLRPYDLPEAALLPVAPGVAGSVEVFPLAGTSWAVARDLGLASRFNYNWVSSRVGDIEPKTRWFAYELDLRGRLRLGSAPRAPLLGFELGLGRQAFLFSGAGPTADILPSVDYYYVRFGADGRIPLEPVTLLVGAAYRHLQSRRGPRGDTVPAAGTFGEHFPDADIAGLDAKLGLALRLNAYLEGRVVLNYTRYWSTLNAKPGDTYLARSAFDQLLNADVGIAACF